VVSIFLSLFSFFFFFSFSFSLFFFSSTSLLIHYIRGGRFCGTSFISLPPLSFSFFFFFFLSLRSPLGTDQER